MRHNEKLYDDSSITDEERELINSNIYLARLAPADQRPDEMHANNIRLLLARFGRMSWEAQASAAWSIRNLLGQMQDAAWIEQAEVGINRMARQFDPHYRQPL